MLPRLFPGLQTERTVPLQGSNDRSTISMEEIRQIPAEENQEIPSEENREIPGEEDREISSENNQEIPDEEVQGAGAVSAEL